MIFLRRLHLYLGCFFAPMLLFFAVSGMWQVLDWHRAKGPGSNFLRLLSTIHMGGGLKKAGGVQTLNSSYLEIFVMLMAAGLVVSIVLGIVMAFRFGRGRLALASLGLGVVIPVLLILCFAH